MPETDNLYDLGSPTRRWINAHLTGTLITTHIDGGGSAVAFNDDIDMGTNAITNVGNVDGVDISSHSTRHENGGADEINVSGLSGDLSDAQDPKTHASTHFDGGADELDAADLSGADGTSGQYLKTDGATASWADLSISSEFIAYEPGITQWGSGLSNEEIYMMQLQSGETFYLDRIELRLKGGGSNSDVSLDVYDSTGSTQIDSVNAGSTSTTGGSRGSGNLIQFRISNASGGTVNAVPIIRGRIE